MADDLSKIRAILEANKSKSFVNRIINYQNSPRLDLGGGQYATHKMAWTEADGKYYVYPTVLLQGDNTLKEYKPDDAWRQVRQSGNFIEFNSPNDADWFSRNYKRIWPNGGQ